MIAAAAAFESLRFALEVRGTVARDSRNYQSRGAILDQGYLEKGASRLNLSRLLGRALKVLN